MKSKTIMSWNSRKKEDIFCTTYFAQRNILWHLCFIKMSSVLNTLSEYKYFYISKKYKKNFKKKKNFTNKKKKKKKILQTLLLLVFKIVESLQCIFKELTKIWKNDVSSRSSTHSYQEIWIALLKRSVIISNENIA